MIPPKPFIGFTIVFWIIFAIDAVGAWSVFEAFSAEMLTEQNDELTPAELEDERRLIEYLETTLLGSYAVIAGFLAILWGFITYRTSKAARWLYVGWITISTVTLPFSLDGAETSEIARSVVSASLGCASAVMLFLPSARAWFKAGGEPISAKVFE